MRYRMIAVLKQTRRCRHVHTRKEREGGGMVYRDAVGSVVSEFGGDATGEMLGVYQCDPIPMSIVLANNGQGFDTTGH